MAFCTSCGHAMGTLETVCPSCGYDFTAGGGGTPAPGPARTDPARVALLAGAAGAGLGAAWAALKAVASAYQGYASTAAAAAIASLLLVGLLGLFLRARSR
jgi:hypothetical protein